MAISKINKVEIIGLQKDKEELLGLLQKLGIVELLKIEDSAVDLTTPLVSNQVGLLEIEEVISYLASFKEKPGFLKGLVRIKPLVYPEGLQEVIANFDYQSLLKNLSELRSHLKSLSEHKERLIQEKQALAAWENLDIPLDELRYTKNCGILLGLLRRADYPNLLKDCKDINLFCETINQDRTNTYLAIIYLQKNFEYLQVILKNHHFNFVTLSRHKGTVKQRIFEINREVIVLDDQIQDTKEKIANLSRERFRFMVIYDYLSNIERRQAVDKNLVKQQFTFILSGWIKAKDTKLLEKTLTDKFGDLAIFIWEPKNEDVPVELENNVILEPFEFITKIYGMPKYNELDPTPFLAPFFFLYFGFCVSDVGYGLILILLCYFILKKFKLGPQGLRFFRLFLFCGISTVIAGALTGSWFGNLLELASESNRLFLPLKKFKDSLVVLDPLKQPTKLLGIALSLGIIQVWFGNIVAAIGNLKNRRYLDIVLDQLPMLAFLFGLTGLGLIFLGLLDKTQPNLFKYFVLLAAIALLLTQGRFEKSLGAKLFYGAYNLYNTFSGYLSDILSYSRLWALGLVTTVTANTINLISLQFSSIVVVTIPFLNKLSFLKIVVSSLILITIFLAGHLISFLMNLLSAFVHSLRLQFVEFFSKFFKSGGRIFRPFKIETRYINLT